MIAFSSPRREPPGLEKDLLAAKQPPQASPLTRGLLR